MWFPAAPTRVQLTSLSDGRQTLMSANESLLHHDRVDIPATHDIKLAQPEGLSV